MYGQSCGHALVWVGCVCVCVCVSVRVPSAHVRVTTSIYTFIRRLLGICPYLVGCI